MILLAQQSVWLGYFGVTDELQAHNLAMTVL